MDAEAIEEELGKELLKDHKREKKFGEYHPSTISGCPLKGFLDRMTRDDVPLNRWIFNGKAVHHYLQETGILSLALHRAGYHMMETQFEVNQRYNIGDGIVLNGTTDILAHDGASSVVFDIKYSSIPATSGHGRLYKYGSQCNTYASMFGADEWALIMINSKSDNIPEDIVVIDQETDEENWELTKNKARSIHSALDRFGYEDGEEWDNDTLEDRIEEFWKKVMKHFDRTNCPSYEKECQYCSHSDYCPVKQGMTGGLKGMGE